MPAPILATKLYIHPPRPQIVSRLRLIERLNEGLSAGRKLTLISAPAGFGKTTLVSEWLADLRLCNADWRVSPGELTIGNQKSNTNTRNFAWLSLDEADSDLTRFLAYLVAALQTFAPKMGAGVITALQSSQPLPTEAILTALLNEIAVFPQPFTLILDDYHTLEAPQVDDALTFLLDHLPPQMHLVIASREDPPLPLARLRARGQLTELRAADLRFTPAEAAEFLNQGMGLHLSAEDVAALEARTEGWIAGLQLAALALQGATSNRGQTDIASFIQSFTGSHRFVLDYLVEEVLQRQTEPIRSFLLQTAILDRLSGPLCDAVTGQKDGKGMLEILERGNLFVVALDDQRQWYRYHHLFADVLQTHWMEAQPDQLSTLHRRASEWYEQNGLHSDAIRHALAAEDFERAAGLIELAWSAMDISYQSAAWLGWVKKLPDHLVRTRPVLSAGYAWALLDGGELEASETRLQDAERWLELASRSRPDDPLPGMIVVDEMQFRSLPASIATARAYRALALGDIPGTVQHAQQALQLTPPGDSIRHIQATSLLGLAQYASGDLEAAECSLAAFQANLRKTSEILTLIGITFLLADIRMTLGHLQDAESTYQQALRLAASQGEPLPIGTADLYRGISELSIERGDLEAAAQHLLTSQKLGEQAALTDWQHRLCVAQARLKEAQGDLDSALTLLDEAERQYIRGPLPDVRPLAALKTRVWLKLGWLTEALGWVRERGLCAADDLNYLGEFEHLTLAKVLIARYHSDREIGFLHEAIALLERLLHAAEAGRRTGSVIEILVVQALAYQAQGSIPLALATLERALGLAESEGYVRIFVDEGEPMRLLILDYRSSLEPHSPRGHHPLCEYVERLLVAFPQRGAVTQQSAIKNHKSELIEPLSERELDVLRLLATELSGPEIARQLIVSLNTLRTHTKNIFNKLGVNNRRAAVRRAQELDLL